MAYAIPKRCQLRQYPFSVQFLLKNGALLWEPCAFGACGVLWRAWCAWCYRCGAWCAWWASCAYSLSMRPGGSMGPNSIPHPPPARQRQSGRCWYYMGLLNPLRHPSNVFSSSCLYTFPEIFPTYYRLITDLLPTYYRLITDFPLFRA